MPVISGTINNTAYNAYLHTAMDSDSSKSEIVLDDLALDGTYRKYVLRQVSGNTDGGNLIVETGEYDTGTSTWTWTTIWQISFTNDSVFMSAPDLPISNAFRVSVTGDSNLNVSYEYY